MLRIGTAEYFASFEEFLKHLPVGRDEELLILKGHLLIERKLEQFLAHTLPAAGALTDANLRFAQKLAVARSLRADPRDDWMWEAIGGLNRLRNELVHQLPGPRFEALVSAFTALVERSPELPDLEPPPDIQHQLHRAIFIVHEAISHRVDL